jgi:hypothetical protein
MSDVAFLVIVLGLAIVLLAATVAGLVAIALIAIRWRRDESGLGDEDVASILGYPMWPVHTPRNGSTHE